MRKNFGAKSWLYPMPVFMIATYDDEGNPDIMNAAWGGMYDEDQIMLCLAHDHKTTQNIRVNKAFTVSFATAPYAAECDYLGIVSANQTPDKVKISGLTVQKSEFVNAPVINELPMAIECEFIKFNEDGMVIGKIVNVSADESIVTENGSLDVKKMDPISFDSANYRYWSIGEAVGKAFSDGKKFK